MLMLRAAALTKTDIACLIAGGLTALNIAVANDLSGGATQDTKKSAEELIADRCNTCHAISSVLVRRAPPEEWQEIVNRMVTYGADVTEPEVETIVSYLSEEHGLESGRED